MCDSGQELEEGEVDSEVDLSGNVGHGAARVVKEEKQIPLRPASASMRSQRPLAQPSSTPALDERPAGSSNAPAQGVPTFSTGVPQEAHIPVSGKVGAFAKSSDTATASLNNHLSAAASESTRDWATDSIRELLELKGAAHPGTPLEVATALQQDLRSSLLLDVTEGDPQDGEPSAIGLLRVLDQRVEALRARLADD